MGDGVSPEALKCVPKALRKLWERESQLFPVHEELAAQLAEDDLGGADAVVQAVAGIDEAAVGGSDSIMCAWV